MLRSYSVIVPVLNKQREIAAALRSIADSMSFFNDNHPEADKIIGEVIVVDEGSSDGTLESIQACVRDDSRFRLVQHHRSLGIGPARNTGARMSRGEVLFFCDGDDLFFPAHLFVGFCILDHSAAIGDVQSETIHLRVGNRGHVVFSAKKPVAAVRTGVYVKDAIHPHWKTVIRDTIAQNLCVLRACHEWSEGFPEELVYKRIGGCEDVAYTSCLDTFFRVGRIEMETVEYIRYPGNSFDRQIERFQHPPGSRFDTATPEQEAVHAIRRQLEEQKIGYLLDKWLVLTLPALDSSLLNWPGVVAELLRRRRNAEACRVAEQAARQGHSLPPALLDELVSAQKER